MLQLSCTDIILQCTVNTGGYFSIANLPND